MSCGLEYIAPGIEDGQSFSTYQQSSVGIIYTIVINSLIKEDLGEYGAAMIAFSPIKAQGIYKISKIFWGIH